ncbi:14128_t:CDS:2 [Funneliformis caledonium]|uniref:14128_t:CDS:1 n=2 Tax=Funneliformis TaxID=1117308 RepID=A0A9N9FI76_9GLOM|nr:14128_t:CDS:2 [Funneliformis caledonium]CAG8667341.1 8989_t:CDS:2 [Funneliformis mosseae]
MSGVVPYVAGWVGFGFTVRVVALAIQQRPLLQKPMTHALSAAFFGGVGSYIYYLEQRQLELIQKRKHTLLENRKRKREYEEAKAKEHAMAA